jgi:CPA2 family monovalent cation:H+ antiporter-2
VAEQELFGELAVIGGLAVVTTVGLSRVGLPATIGFLTTGALAGPHGVGLVGDTDHIEQIAEVGVILLLFAIGLEFSLARLRFIWRAVALGGSLQVGVTTLAALAILVMAGDTVERGIVFGLVVALSSTVVVLRVLDIRGELDAPHGRFIVGALIFQDLLVIPLTLLVPVLAGGDTSGLAFEAAWALARATLAVGTVLIVARYLIPRFFDAVDATRTREVFLLSVISIALGSAWLMNQIGLSFALGAFLAGILLADTDYSHRATSDIIPLRDAFTSFFFISLGMLVDWRIVTEEPVVAVLIVLGLVLGKAVIASLAALAMRNPASVAWRSGVYLAQFGEFGYIVLVLGASEGIVTSDELRLVVTTGVVSIVLSRLLMRWTGGLHAGETLLRPLERLLRARGIDEPTAQDQFLTDHVVIAGYGIAGQLLAHTLAQARIPYVVLELNAETVREARRDYAHVYYGDITSPEALAHARLGHARLLVLMINDPPAARRAIVAVRDDWPNVPILVRTRYVAEREGLLDLGANHVVCEEIEGGTEMSAWTLRALGLNSPTIRAQISQALASSSAGDLTGATGEWIAAADEQREGLPRPFAPRPDDADQGKMPSAR